MELEVIDSITIIHHLSKEHDEYIDLALKMARYEILYIYIRLMPCMNHIDSIDNVNISSSILHELIRYRWPSMTTLLSLAILGWTVMRRVDSDWYIYIATVRGTRTVYAISMKSKKIALVGSSHVIAYDIVPLYSISQLYEILPKYRTYPFYTMPSHLLDDRDSYVKALKSTDDRMNSKILLQLLEPDSNVLDILHTIETSNMEDILRVVLLYKDVRTLSYLLYSISHSSYTRKIYIPMRDVWYPTDITFYFTS